MAAVEEMAITPLPNPNRPGRMVEEVEEITAKLLMNWAMRFCSGERARQRRCSVGTGGAVAASLLRAVKAKECDGAGECVGQALAFFWSSDARRGDFGRACAPRGEQLLRRSATAALSVF